MLNISPRFGALLEELAPQSSVAYLLNFASMFGTSEEGDYLDIEKDNISFLPTARVKELGRFDDPYTFKGRQSGRAARVARKFIDNDFDKLLLTDADLERFANLIKAQQARLYAVFSIVEGKDMIKWYSEGYYAPSSGTLNNSCMRYAQCQRYFGIYADNPDTIKMLILTDKDKTVLFARALLWYTNQGIVMDRVYGSDAHQTMFEKYAKEQGWCHKARKGAMPERLLGPTSFIDPTGKHKQIVLTVPLKKATYDKYPYMDTFKYLDRDNMELTNMIHMTSQLYLESTDGSYNRAN